MHVLKPISRDPSAPSPDDDLRQQLRYLQERLAFYEGFDALIQDNVAHARELFRLAAQEREAAALQAEQARHAASQREAALRSELEALAAELHLLSAAIEGLSQRVARALGESRNGKAPESVVRQADRAVAIVAHGVPSARAALSLQRFIGALPHVSEVSAREFAGGIFRLDARVRDRLRADELAGWDGAWQMQVLTERPEVLEVALDEAARVPASG